MTTKEENVMELVLRQEQEYHYPKGLGRRICELLDAHHDCMVVAANRLKSCIYVTYSDHIDTSNRLGSASFPLTYRIAVNEEYACALTIEQVNAFPEDATVLEMEIGSHDEGYYPWNDLDAYARHIVHEMVENFAWMRPERLRAG